MKHSKRIHTICKELPEVKTFADIGCDHGYIAEYMLKNGLCERAYISDISRESLKKAEKLLAEFIAAGRCVPVCADGLSGIHEPCDLVLIAGMGGEEIVHILEGHDLPARFALQPMKNSEKVREFLISRGAKITRDFTFQDGKFYDFIAGVNAGGDNYTDFELRFGRDNLLNPSDEFLKMIYAERSKLRRLEQRSMKRETRAEIRERLRYFEEVTDALDDNL